MSRMKTPLQREYIPDRGLNRAQANSLEAHRTLNNTPFTPRDGVLVSNVTLSAGKETVVTHGLGRPIVGCTPVLVKKAAWRAYVTASDNSTVTLFQENGFMDPVVNLWVC